MIPGPDVLTPKSPFAAGAAADDAGVFPGRVEQSAARVGLDLAELSGPLLTVSSGELVVRVTVNPGQRELLAEEMPVEILSELLGISAAGEIAAIGELATDGNGVRGHPTVVRPVGGSLDEQLAGADVRLTVTAAATDGPVLVVPLSAVFASADGQVSVLRVDGAGEQSRVPVVAGASGDGYVAVTPLDGDGVLDLISDLHRDGVTVLLITHAPAIASRAQRRIHIRDGRVSEA